MIPDKPDGARWRVDPLLHGRIRWTTANLVDPAAVAPLADTDVIFCRNVLIYFDAASKARAVERLLSHLSPHGLLFLGQKFWVFVGRNAAAIRSC